jgi:two-component system sensor histidine kinase KdpD
MRTTQQNAERTQSLYAFSKTIAAAATLDDITGAVVREVAQSLKAKTILLLPQGDRLESAACFPPNARLDTASSAAMDWAFRHGKPAGFNSDTLPHAPFYGLPLRRGDSTVGVLALSTDDKKPLSSEQEHFLAGLASQSAVAIERARLAANIARTKTD